MLNHAHRVLSMLQMAGDKGCLVSTIKACPEFPKSDAGVPCYRLSTYIWEVEKKLGKKVERLREGRKTVGFKLVMSDAELLEAKKMATAAKRAATKAAKQPGDATVKVAKVKKPKKAVKLTDDAEKGAESQPPIGNTEQHSEERMTA